MITHGLLAIIILSRNIPLIVRNGKIWQSQITNSIFVDIYSKYVNVNIIYGQPVRGMESSLY